MAPRIKIYTGPSWEFIRSHAVDGAARNLWRFKGRMEMDDLVQEGFLVYERARARYTEHNEVFILRQFVAYFRSAFLFHILDLAKSDNRGRLAIPVSSSITEVELARDDRQFEESEFRLLLASAPPDIRMLAEKILEEDSPESLTQARVCELAGISPKGIKKLRERIREFLGI